MSAKEPLPSPEQLAEENKRLREELETVKREYEEEHKKAEWLYSEYLSLKNNQGVQRTLQHQGTLWRLRQKFVYGFLNSAARSIYSLVPGGELTKLRLKNLVYARFGKFFQETPAYREWYRCHHISEDSFLRGDYATLTIPQDMPLITVLIPVYNHLDLTRNCLYSIFESETRSKFEVMIVDDCSEEDHSCLLKEFPGIRVERNEKNLGFLLSVNQALPKAKGEYIVLLNNDTVVMKGWLDELACALYHHREAGMIGSALVHIRTGTLQECGDVICKNGDIVPIGRGETPDLHQYAYMRPVDFCSAASVIMRKSVLLDEMHGFDEMYVPAYFDDADLGLRLRKAGYTNYVLPLSRVMHHESVSYGDALEREGERSRALFLKRWKDWLGQNAFYASAREFYSGTKPERERVLYIDAQVPQADRDSGGVDAIFFLNYLKKRDLDVVFFGEYTPGIVPKYSAILMRMGVDCIFEPQLHFRDYIREHGKEFQYLFVSRIYQARDFDELLHLYCPNAAYIFNTVDLHFVREQLEADLKDDNALRKHAAETKKYELACISRADATIVISTKEKELLENEYGKQRIWHIPQAREVFGLNRLTERKGAAFIGSAHPPNLDGLRYFHDSVLPLLPADFHLTIIGEALKNAIGASKEYRDLLKCPQFEFVGFVEDLRDVLDSVVLTVAPLRYGAGTKGKVASSMACGVPCVSSAFGIEGTGMEDGVNILVAPTPEAFAEAIRRLNTDPALWKTISDGGIRFLEENYSVAAVEQKMDALLKAVRERHAAGESTWAAGNVLPKVG